jgi:thiamine pyrophosphate-dependent acetolactate synthase large subunit-like protein
MNKMEIKIGYSVVYLHDKNKDIYRVKEIFENKTCEIINSFGCIKTTDLNYIREATDVELMIGYRLDDMKTRK